MRNLLLLSIFCILLLYLYFSSKKTSTPNIPIQEESRNPQESKLQQKKLTYENAVYEGEVKNNQRHGKGKLKFTKGVFKGLTIEGKWKNDIKVGKFIGIDNTHTHHEGFFKDGTGFLKGVKASGDSSIIHFAIKNKGESNKTY